MKVDRLLNPSFPPRRRLLSRIIEAIGVALLGLFLWRVFFTTSVSFSTMAVAIGAAGIAGALLEGRSVRTIVDGPVAVYLAFTLLSAAIFYGRYPAFAGLNPVAPWHPGAHLALVVAYFYGVVYLLNTPRRLGALLSGLTIAVSAIGLIAVYDHARFGFDTRIWDYPLLPQWLGYPQIGLLLSSVFPIALAVVIATSPVVPLLAAAVAAGVMAAMVTTLYSRAALVATVVGYVALSAIEVMKVKNYRLVTAGVAVGLVTFLWIGATGRTQWIAGLWTSSQYGWDTTTSVNSRTAVWRRTTAMIRDHPLLGVGPGNYTTVLETGYVAEKLRENGHAHNMPLHIAAEQGLPAALAFLLVWYRLGSMLVRRGGRHYSGVLAVGCFGALLAFFTRSLSDYFLASTGSPSERTAFVMWTLLAAGAAVGRLRSPDIDSTEARVALPLRETRLIFSRVSTYVWNAWHDGRLAFCLALLVGVAVEAQVLFVASKSIRAVGLRPYVVESFGAGVPVGQTFRMDSDGLASVWLRFFANRPTEIVVRSKLLTGGRGGDPWEGLHEWTSTVDLAAGHTWHRFRFPAVVPSERNVYQFQLRKLTARAVNWPSAGKEPVLGLVGSRDDSLRDGNVIDGSTQVVGRDLFFEAQADDSAFSIFRRNMNPHLPKPLRPRAVQLMILALYNLALAAYLYYMLVIGPRIDSGLWQRRVWAAPLAGAT